MKMRKAERFVSDAERRDKLKARAEAAGAFFAKTGGLPACWNRYKVTGAMVHYGFASHAALKAAGMNVPLKLKGQA